MRGLLSAMVLGGIWLGAAAPGMAENPPSPARQAQNERMRQCNAEAKRDELKGDARRGFMRQCLSRRPEGGTRGEARPTAEQQRAQGSAALAAAVPGYRTEAEAKAACGDDAVVWGSRDSRIFHLANSRFYGTTQQGSYLCRTQAELGGYRAAR
jgi:psiF repeat